MKWCPLLVLLSCLLAQAYAENPRVAVLTFETLSASEDDNWLGAGFADSVASKLTSVESALRVMERRRVAEVLRTQEIQQEQVQEDQTGRVGQVLGVDYLILGSVQLLGPATTKTTPIRVNTRVVAAATGQIVGGKSLTLDGDAGSLFEVQSDLSLKYCELLGVEPLLGEKQHMLESETKSLEAYRYFILGNLYLDAGEYRDAIRLYDEALRAHEDYFAEAHHNQGTAYQRLANAKSDMAQKEETAQEYEERVNTLTAINARVFFEQGRMYMFREKYREAVDSYEKYMENADVPKTVFWRTDLNVGAVHHTYWVKNLVLQGTYAGLYALDDRNGSIVWHYPNAMALEPATDGDQLFVVNLNGPLVWLNLEDGTERHVHPIDSSGYIQEGPLTSTSIAYHAGTVIHARADGVLEALDAGSGELLWRSSDCYVGRQDMKIPVYENKVFVGKGRSIAALDIRTGTLLNLIPQSREVRGVALKYPVLVTCDGRSELAAVDVSSGETLWQQTLDGDHQRKLFIFGTTILTHRDDYQAEDGGELIALDLETGREKWRSKQLGPGAPSYSIVSSGKAIYINRTEHIVVADVDSGGIWWTYRQDAFSWNRPALHDGRLYCADTGGRVSCINAAPERPPQQDYKVMFEMGRARRQLGQYDAAKKDFEKAINISEQIRAEAYMELARIAHNEENWEMEILNLFSVLRSDSSTNSASNPVVVDPEGNNPNQSGPADQARTMLADTIGLKWFSLMENHPAMQGRHPGGTSHLSLVDQNVLVPMAYGLEAFNVKTGRLDKVYDVTTSKFWHFSMSPSISYKNGNIVQDAMDAVTSVDSATGDLLWFLPKCSINRQRHIYNRREMILEDGKLYFSHNLGFVFAVDPDSGAPIWAYSLDYDSFGGMDYNNGQIFTGNYNGEVHAIDAQNGGSLWITSVGAPVAARPCTDDSKIFVGTVSGAVVCLDQQNGSVLWESQLGGAVFGPPSLGGGLLIVACDNRYLYALRPDNGEVVWKTLVAYTTTTPPVVLDGQLIYTFEFGPAMGIDPVNGSILWSFPRGRSWDIGPLVHGDSLVQAEFWGGAVYAISLPQMMDFWRTHPRTTFEEEINQISEAFDGNFSDPTEQVERITRLTRLDALGLAKVKCDKWISSAAQSPAAWFALGYVEHRRDNFEEAYSALDKARELGYSGATLFRILGESAEKTGRLREAVDAYKRLRQVDFHWARRGSPRTMWAIFNLANAKDMRGELEEAKLVYRELLDNDVFVWEPTDEGNTHRITRNGSELEHLRRYLELEDDPGYRTQTVERMMGLYSLRFGLDYLDDTPFAEVIARTRPDSHWFQGLIAGRKLAHGAKEYSLWNTVEKGLQSAISARCPVGIELILRPLRTIRDRVSEEAPELVKVVIERADIIETPERDFFRYANEALVEHADRASILK